MMNNHEQTLMNEAFSQETFINQKSTTRKTLLFLFAPKHINNHCIRPLTYNFGYESLNYVDDVLTHGGLSSLSNPQVGNELISKHGVITPNTKPIPVNLNKLSDNWTFCLIIDNGVSSANFQALPAKMVITGICDNEPVSSASINITPVLNKECNLIPTNCITMSHVPQISPSGTTYTQKITNHIDIITAISEFLPQGMFLHKSSPRDLVTNIYNEEYDLAEVFTPTTSNEKDELTDAELNPAYESLFIPHLDNNITDINKVNLGVSSYNPAEQIGGILTSLQNAIYDTHQLYDEYSLGLGHLSEMVCENIAATIPDSNVTNHNAPHTGNMLLGSVVHTYSPEVVIIKNKQSYGLDVVDSTITTPETIASNLLLEILPAYLLKYGLSGISFGYDSFSRNFQVFMAEFMANETVPVQQKKIEHFKVLLEREVIPMCRSLYGDFSLNVQINIIGQSVVDINFYDTAQLLNGYHVNTNLLKGYTAPILSDYNTMYNNTDELNSFINNLSHVIETS